MGPRPHLCFFCVQNSIFSIRIASLYGSQTSPVILCMQNNVISIRITSLYGSQPSCVVFASKPMWLESELLVSMGPRPHLSWIFSQNSDFWIRITILYGSQTSPMVLNMQNNVSITSLYGSQPSSVVFACKTASFGSELQVSKSPRPHLCFLCVQNSIISTRIASLYRSQTSPVVLCMQNNVISIRITSLYGSQTSPVVLCMQNNVISIRITSL